MTWTIRRDSLRKLKGSEVLRKLNAMRATGDLDRKQVRAALICANSRCSRCAVVALEGIAFCVRHHAAAIRRQTERR